MSKGPRIKACVSKQWHWALHMLAGPHPLAAILSSLVLDFIKLALVADSNLFRHEPNFDIQTALRSKPDRCL